MRRLISILLIIIFGMSISFAQGTDYEKKLEYKRKKIEILVKTRLVGEVSGYTTTDIYETIISPEAGYQYKWGYATARTGGTTQYREVSDWIILKGGIRELSDLEFLEMTGNIERIQEISRIISERNRKMWIGNIIGLLGIGTVLYGSSQGSSGTITTGAIFTLAGIIMSTINSPQKHYIMPDFAQEEADKYNIRLKKSLGLPLEFE